MPENKHALRRYFIIDQCLTNKQIPYPTKAFLLKKCCEQLETKVSVSTLEKDLQDLKHDTRLGFSAPISYDRSRGGYCYTEPGYSIRHLLLGKPCVRALLELLESIFKRSSAIHDVATAEAALYLLNCLPINVSAEVEYNIRSATNQ